MRSHLSVVALTEQHIPPNRSKRGTTELVAIQVMSILLLFIYPVYLLRGVIPCVPALGGEMVQEHSAPPFWIFMACFLMGVIFMIWLQSWPTQGVMMKLGTGAVASQVETILGKKKPLKLLSLPKISSGTPVGPSLWMCDTCLLDKSSLWSTYFLLPHVFIFFSPFKYFLPLAVCDWTPWSLNSLGISPLL